MAQTTTLGMSKSEYSRILKKYDARKKRLRAIMPKAIVTAFLISIVLVAGYAYTLPGQTTVYIPNTGTTTTKKAQSNTQQTTTTPTQSGSTNQQATTSKPKSSSVYIPQISPTSPVAYPQINGSYGSSTYDNLQQQYDSITNRLKTQPSKTCPSGYYGGGGYGAVCN